MAVFAVGVVHLSDDDEDDAYGDDDDDDDHRGELDSLDPLQVDPAENQVELFIVKDCDPSSRQVLVVGGSTEKYPNIKPSMLKSILILNRVC